MQERCDGHGRVQGQGAAQHLNLLTTLTPHAHLVPAAALQVQHIQQAVDEVQLPLEQAGPARLQLLVLGRAGQRGGGGRDTAGQHELQPSQDPPKPNPRQ